jgi:hypothetical protein
MAVELRSLRVTSDFDAGRYVAGMQQKVAADRAGTDSSKAAGQAVEGMTIKVSSAVPMLERLSRTYIDGYGNAAKFNGEIMRLARSQETNAASVQHLELIYAGLQKRFGLIADATEITKRGYSGLATAIENVNARLSQSTVGESATAMSARIEALRQQFDPAYVSAQRLASELDDLAEAERLNVQITGGYEKALDGIILKHDAVAAAAKRQRDEYSRLAQEAREAQAADRAQSSFNSQLGVGGGTGLRAADSAAVFSRQLEVERMKMEQEAENFASDLQRRFGFGNSAGSARDSASVFSAEIARQEEMERLRRQQQGSAFSSDLNDRLGINGYGTNARASASVFEESARSAEQLERQVAGVRAQIDPLSAAQARLNAEMAEYQSLADRGAISTDELGKAQAVARQRYDTFAQEMQRQQKKGVSGLPGYQLTNLMYQGTDVVQSLALGMPLSQVALQQGPQIAQIFAADSSAIKGLVSSVGVATAAVTASVAVIAIGAKAWNDYIVSVKAVETAASGLGRAVSAPASELEAAAQAGAAAANISIKAARDMEAQFLRTGKIGSENYERLIGISKNFGATIGVDTTAAGQQLAQMFADPAAAAETLSKQYGLIDAATAEYAQNLAQQNRLSEAQRVILDALPDRLAKAAEATTALGRAWQNVGYYASQAYDWMGKRVDRAFYGPSLEEQIAAAQAAQDRMKNSPVSSFFSLFSPTGAQDFADSTRLQQLQEEKRRRDEQEARDREAARLSNAGVAAVGTADQSSSVANLVQIQTLRNQIATLEAQRTGTSPEQDERINTALEAKKTLLEGLISRQTRLTQIEQMDIAISNERNPILRAELIARRTRLDLSMQEMSATERNAAVTRAYNSSIEEFVAGNRAQITDMQTELSFRTKLNDQVAAGTMTRGEAQAKLQEELALRPLVLAYDTAEGERKAELKKILDELRQSYEGLAAAERQAAATDYIRSQSDSLDRLRLQQSTVGQSQGDQARSLAQFDAEKRIRDLAIDATGEQAQQIRELSKAIAEQNLSLDRSKNAWETYRSAGTSAIDGIFDGIVNGDKLSDIGKSLVDDINKTILTLGIANPLKNGLFGTNLGTFSDLFKGQGGGLGSLFGDRGVGAMNVTAGTVVINGGTGSLLGGVLGGAANDNFQANTTLGKMLGIGAANDNGITGGSISAFSKAIQSIESGGNYSALGPLTRTGDRAYGAYQVMGANVGPWTQQALGYSMTPSAFLASPSSQDAVFKKVFGGYVGKYGASGAAQAWFGGPGSVGQGGSAQDILGTSGTEYVNKFNSALGRLGETTTSAVGDMRGLGPAVGNAAQGLNSFGNGVGQFGQSLGKIQQGGGGGFFSDLLGGIGKMFGGISPTSSLWAPNTTYGAFLGLSGGGYTGPGGIHEPRGVVHAGEIVWSQDDIARNGGVGTVEAMRLGRRGYATGGVVFGSGNMAAGSPNGRPQAANVNVGVTVINNNGSDVKVQKRNTADGLQLDVIVDQVVAEKINTPGSQSRGAMKSQFGLSGSLARR